MVNTYKDYLEKPKVLTFEQMGVIHEQLLEEVADDADALELYDDLVEIATQYGQVRAKWKQLTRDEKAMQNDLRTACHDSVISYIDMLARYLKKQGKATQWRDTLGDPKEDKYNRKSIGDFACYIVFINSICAR